MIVFFELINLILIFILKCNNKNIMAFQKLLVIKKSLNSLITVVITIIIFALVSKLRGKVIFCLILKWKAGEQQKCLTD